MDEKINVSVLLIEMLNDWRWLLPLYLNDGIESATYQAGIAIVRLAPCVGLEQAKGIAGEKGCTAHRDMQHEVL